MKALITGVNGQDGSYLAELLLGKGYEVHGVVRRSSTINTERIDHIFPPEASGKLHYGDLEEGLSSLIYDIKPDEVYNLAAMSQVRTSFEIPIYTGLVNAVGVTRLLEAVKKIGCKFYQASSSEMYGTTKPPQNEETKFNPVSPYGCAKLYAYHMVRTYRQGYGMFACNGILFNHESPRRGHNFVTKKIVNAAVKIRLGLQDKLHLGNLKALRDWGHAKDYVRAMWLIMQAKTANDWVVSTGEYHTVEEFLEKVFNYLHIDVSQHVVYDTRLLRPNEVPALLGDSSKIRKELGWKPEYNFNSLVKEMIEEELKREKDKLQRKGVCTI